MNEVSFQTEEDQYQQMLQAGTANAQYQRQMEEQKALAARLRENGMDDKGQMVSGHYIPPNVLGQIGGFMNERNANKADKAGSAAGAAYDASQASQNQTVLQALLRNRGGGVEQMPPANPFPGANYQ